MSIDLNVRIFVIKISLLGFETRNFGRQSLKKTCTQTLRLQREGACRYSMRSPFTPTTLDRRRRQINGRLKLLAASLIKKLCASISSLLMTEMGFPDRLLIYK